MEIGEIVEIGERKIEVTPAKREQEPPRQPEAPVTPERVKEPA